MFEIVLPILLFVISLIILVKGSDYFIEGAESIGIALGLTSFIIGVVILGLGTSLPEISSSLAAVFQGESSIPPANVIGSNITNVLLVLGVVAVAVRKLVVTKNLIDVDLPLLAGITIIFFGVSYDGVITQPESLILLVAFVFYLFYAIFQGKEQPLQEDPKEQIQHAKNIFIDIGKLIFGGVLVIVGANYLIDAAVSVGVSLGIGSDIVALVGIAIGTSLPELAVSLNAALKGKAEIAVGNIIGSNVFNLTIVVGLSGLFGVLTLDGKVLTLALPALIFVTFMIVLSGISRKIHLWEGMIYLLAFVLFISKLFDIL